MQLRIFILTLLLFPSLSSLAETSLNVDLIVAGATDSSTDQNGMSIRTLTSFMFHSDEIAFGPTFYFEKPNAPLQTFILGGTFSIGNDWFFQTTFGYLISSVATATEKGWGIIPQFGKSFQISSDLDLRVSLPIVIKIISTGTPERTMLDYVPYIGVQLKL